MSSSYERVNYITSFGFSLRWRRQFLESIGASDDPLEIIDLMTGMGETWTAVKHRFPNANLSALDFSAGMLSHAETKNRRHFRSAVTLLQQDVLRNELPEKHYDLVICAFGLKTLDETQWERLAHETRRILKDGGRFSFIEVSKPTYRFLRFLYRLHLGKVVPVAGSLLLGNPVEYRMLWKYTHRFGDARPVAETFRRAGLHVTYRRYFGGCATGFYGSK